jgi:hypothetical protein
LLTFMVASNGYFMRGLRAENEPVCNENLGGFQKAPSETILRHGQT